MIVHGGLKRMRKEVVVACFKLLSQHLPVLVEKRNKPVRIFCLQAKI
jgi:hypothetical protein